MTASMMTVKALSPALGAEVSGLDLRTALDAETIKQLNHCLLEHIVVVIRAQQFTPAEYVNAMKIFGKPARQNHVEQLLDGNPEIWVIDSRKGQIAHDGQRVIYGANAWHTDHANMQLPPKITSL